MNEYEFDKRRLSVVSEGAIPFDPNNFRLESRVLNIFSDYYTFIIVLKCIIAIKSHFQFFGY